MHQANETSDILTRCSHIFEPTSDTPARACGSPALHGQSFCFYHHPAHHSVATRGQRRACTRARKAARRAFTVPVPRTHLDVVNSALWVVNLIETDQIDLHRASQLLAALNIAGRNLTQ